MIHRPYTQSEQSLIFNNHLSFDVVGDRTNHEIILKRIICYMQGLAYFIYKGIAQTPVSTFSQF